MFERFTDKARQVIVEAQNEARGLNHNYIGTEHLLLGLLDGEGVATNALTELGVVADDVRAQVLDIIGQGQVAPDGHIPFTPRAKKVLELALRESLDLKHNYIGTEHILLGMLREGDGVAAQVLVNSGVDRGEAREVVIRLLGTQPAQPPEQSAFGRLRGRRLSTSSLDVRRLEAEIARLRQLLQQHGIDPDENVS